MLTKDNLESLKNTAFKSCICNDLVDITGIEIDSTKPSIKKVAEFMNEVKNPYLFKVDDTPVKVCFSKDAPELQTKITSLIKALQV